jgi:hypothetical protein
MTSTDQLFERLNGHDLRDAIGAHSNAARSVVITKPSHMPRLGWLRRTARDRKDGDRSALWLRNAMVALGVLAVAAAVVSYAAQFHFVVAAKKITAIAALEAGIPDAAAVIFACLGIALALQGKRAVRARILNVGAVATSIFMNFAAAAGTGWRDVAIWVMPPVAYALASDTAIGVVRAWAIARQKALDEALDDDESGPLAILAGVLLWTLRLVLAPPSTLHGFRAWVLDECPVAPGRTAAVVAAEPVPAIEATPEEPPGPGRHREPRAGTKTQEFLRLVAERHGDLAAVALDHVARIAAELAPEVDLNEGSARRELRSAVLAAQDGSAA